MKYNDLKEGCEWLESQHTIYNLLVKAQEVDEELEQCSIRLMDDSYTKEDAEETTSIYIVRGKTDNFRTNTTHSGYVFQTQVEIIIRTSKHDSRKALQLLNSLARCVDAYIHVSNIGAYVYLSSIVPMYTEEGCVHEYHMVYYCTEIQEIDNYPKLCKNLELFLDITSSIRGEHEIERKMKFRKRNNINDEIYDAIPFGGG